MNIKRAIGLILAALVGGFTSYNFLSFIINDLRLLYGVKSAAYIAGKITGMLLIPLLMMYLFIKITLKIRDESRKGSPK